MGYFIVCNTLTFAVPLLDLNSQILFFRSSYRNILLEITVDYTHNSMNNTKVISNVNRKVIDYIKKEIADKKERHAKLMQSISPRMVETLKKMKKVGG